MTPRCHPQILCSLPTPVKPSPGWQLAPQTLLYPKITDLYPPKPAPATDFPILKNGTTIVTWAETLESPWINSHPYQTVSRSFWLYIQKKKKYPESCCFLPLDCFHPDPRQHSCSPGFLQEPFKRFVFGCPFAVCSRPSKVSLLKPMSDDSPPLLVRSRGFPSISNSDSPHDARGPTRCCPLWLLTWSPSPPAHSIHLRWQVCFCPEAFVPAVSSAWHTFSCLLPYLREFFTIMSPISEA